jgi:tRNA1Val (adenine37-N6)-methyltransferase
MNGVDTKTILDRRAYFPRGLVQPEGGYRFSLDSLLLASFVNVTRGQTGVDLGCGCGVIGLALLLRQPGLRLTGVELNPHSVEAAEKNTVNLHLVDKLTIERADVADWRPGQVVDFVVATPPYRKPGQGRENAEAARRNARFEGTGTFAAFARCASLAIKTRGRFAFVHLPERLCGIMADLAEVGLAPKRMRMVHGKADQEARMVLVESVKAANHGLRVEPPLILHEGTGKGTRLSGQALDFCPFLACNPKEGD